MRARLPSCLHLLRRGARPNAFKADESGQSIVEMALLLPILLILVMAIIEFSLAFNATLGINRASQNGALIAAELGGSPGGDCLVLRSIDEDVTTPNDRARILEVQIQRTGPAGGTVYAANVYTRTGSTTCTLADGTSVTVPYTATGTGYPYSQRCSVLSGCPTMTPRRTAVDTVAVQVRYQYTWRTPLSGLLDIIDGHGPKGTSYTFNKRNAFRMEPQL